MTECPFCNLGISANLGWHDIPGPEETGIKIWCLLARKCPLCEYAIDIENDDVAHSYMLDETVHRDCLMDSDEVGGLYFAPRV